MCKLCDDDAKYGHEYESAQSRAEGANLTDVLAADKRDAERYRWLISEYGSCVLESCFCNYEAKSWEQAAQIAGEVIDAAMAANAELTGAR